MKRTRKWEFVAQEARRLADLGLKPREIAAQLGVDRSTITRWIASGKLNSRRQSKRGRPAGKETKPRWHVPKSASQWAKDIRRSYDLDATDDQLVTIAEAALVVAVDPNAEPRVRLQAAGRFQGIVKQLALMARSAAATEAPRVNEPPASPARLLRPRTGSGDPRAILTAVK